MKERMMGYKEKMIGALAEYAKTVQPDSRYSSVGTRYDNIAVVAERHGYALWPEDVPVGVTLDQEVILVDGGLNGKRPLYWVEGTSTFAAGTLFGNQSSFGFLEADEVAAEAERVLPPEVVTRIRFEVQTKPEAEIVIVTRHAGVVSWLAERGITGEVISHASAADVRGKIVYGNLPLFLAAEAERVASIDLPNLKPEQRGKGLTPAEMDEAGANLVTYEVRKV